MGINEDNSKKKVVNGIYGVSYNTLDNSFEVTKSDSSGKILDLRYIKVGETIACSPNNFLIDGNCSLSPRYQIRTEIVDMSFISPEKLEVQIQKVFGTERNPTEKRFYNLDEEFKEKPKKGLNWLERFFFLDLAAMEGE